VGTGKHTVVPDLTPSIPGNFFHESKDYVVAAGHRMDVLLTNHAITIAGCRIPTHQIAKDVG
jgi:hypothetical protein